MHHLIKRGNKGSSIEVAPEKDETSALLENTRMRREKFTLRWLCIFTATASLVLIVYFFYTYLYPKDCIKFQNESLWDKAAALMVYAVFVIFGIVFFIIACEGPYTVISNILRKFVRRDDKSGHQDRLKEENEQLKREKTNLCFRYGEETKQLRDEIDLLQRSVEEERKEKEKALIRLSAIAGDKLRYNNPGIADLSDENRPNKLAEKFSELYDNEWTEALESLNETEESDKASIESLLKTLEEIYSNCMQSAQDQRDALIQVLTKPSKIVVSKVSTAPDNIVSKVVDLQKQTATTAFIDIRNLIIANNSRFAENSSLQKYAERCIELCWLMAIQDPPMMLEFGPAQNEDMDTNKFRGFMKTGEKVDFAVWPAVFLYKNGPIVHKGVLEPIVL